MLKPSNKLLAYLRRAEELGLSPARILNGSGVEWNDGEAIATLEPDAALQLFDHVARRTPPDFAFTCGRLTRVSDFGIVGLAMASAPTLRDAFGCWSHYSVVAAQPFATAINELGREWQLHFSPQRLMTADAQRFCLEASMAALEAIIEELSGAPARSVSIDFAFERPPSVAHYGLLRTEIVRFSRPSTIYYGAREDLDRPLRIGDKETSDAYRREFDAFVTRIANRHSIRDKVEHLIRASTGSIPSVNEMAAHLGLSRRSFQRELEREETSYVMLVRQFRVDHAAQTLERNDYKIKEAAFALGFNTVGSFRRAFQDWMGEPLGKWCERRRTERRA